MIPTRKIGKVLRGKATPFQLVAATVLGAALGFAPALTLAPALYALLVAALLFVNANLGLALVTAALAKLASWVLAPVAFRIGQFLLDGPTEGLAESLVNAPVLAWCGFSYYAVTGGQVLALVFGALFGFLVVRTVTSFRRRMLAAGDEPSRLRELGQRRWARTTMWVFFGGTGKQSWEQKLEKRVGNPIRVWGAVLIVVVLGGAAFAHRQLAEPLARAGVQTGMQAWNGATVDVGPVTLDLGDGRVAVSELAVADPEALQFDLFRAARLEADVDQADFLRRRFHVGRLVVSEARSGARRETPGERIVPEPEDEPEPSSDTFDLEDFSLEDVVADVELWKGRLAQARRWLDRLSGGAGDGEDEGDESWAEGLERRVRELGWFGVEADHLVDEAPTFRLSELLVDGLTAEFLPGRTLDVRASELSTHPQLVDAPPRVEIASRDGALGLVVDLAPASRGGGNGQLSFHWKGLAVDEAMSQLELPAERVPFRGGTLDLVVDGGWDEGRIGRVDLPLRVIFHDTTLRLGDLEPQSLDELELHIGLRGGIDAPRLSFDASSLRDALVAAGEQRLARELDAAKQEVEDKVESELDKKLKELEEKAGEKLPDAGSLLEGILKKKKQPDGR